MPASVILRGVKGRSAQIIRLRVETGLAFRVSCVGYVCMCVCVLCVCTCIWEPSAERSSQPLVCRVWYWSVPTLLSFAPEPQSAVHFWPSASRCTWDEGEQKQVFKKKKKKKKIAANFNALGNRSSHANRFKIIRCESKYLQTEMVQNANKKNR